MDDFFNQNDGVKNELDYIAEAARRNCHPIKIRIEYDVTDKIHLIPREWGNPDLGFLEQFSFNSKPDLIGNEDSVLAHLAIGISKTIQFPESTVFFHGLGVIAAAMTRSFS